MCHYIQHTGMRILDFDVFGFELVLCMESGLTRHIKLLIRT